MKILYLSCHSILEYDEIKLFHELGHDVFSMGAYSNLAGDGKRPALPELPMHTQLHDVAMQCGKEDIHPELIAWADVIVVMHIPEWVTNNWSKFQGKPVIWRTIGQSTNALEGRMRTYRGMGMKIVRYSPNERNFPNFAGEDALIRFYKDPDEFKDWVGYGDECKRVLNFTQNLHQRGEHCNAALFDEVTKDLPTDLFGPGNPAGMLDYEDQKAAIRNHRVYFYVGTQPASYTLNFIEAMMTGIPIVAIGPTLANSIYGNDLYEVPSILPTGLTSDDPEMLRRWLKELLASSTRASEVSHIQRAKAIELFGKETIKEQWRKFFDELSTH